MPVDHALRHESPVRIAKGPGHRPIAQPLEGCSIRGRRPERQAPRAVDPVTIFTALFLFAGWSVVAQPAFRWLPLGMMVGFSLSGAT